MGNVCLTFEHLCLICFNPCDEFAVILILTCPVSFVCIVFVLSCVCVASRKSKRLHQINETNSSRVVPDANTASEEHPPLKNVQSTPLPAVVEETTPRGNYCINVNNH